MKFIMKTIYLAVLSVVLASCGLKSESTLFNMSEQEWFSKIIADIKDRDLELAQRHYTSFASEHIASRLLQPTLLILAQANVDEGLYDQADFYLNEYTYKYGTKDNIEFVEFLKIRSKFNSIMKPNRNEKLMNVTMAQIATYKHLYPDSRYIPLIDTMSVKLNLGRYYLDSSIYDLYNRLDKKDSAEIYKQRLSDSKINRSDMINPVLPWYMRIFK